MPQVLDVERGLPPTVMVATTTATATDIQEVEVVAVAVESTLPSSSLPNWNHRKMTCETVLVAQIPQIDVMFP
jgi:hypothetical protein